MQVSNTSEQVEARHPGGSFSLAEWCQYRGISISFFYKLDEMGKAPVTMKLGRRRLISSEADEAWARARENA
jgi:predicted DNA-binding transcriptional regulator AlpA